MLESRSTGVTESSHRISTEILEQGAKCPLLLSITNWSQERRDDISHPKSAWVESPVRMDLKADGIWPPAAHGRIPAPSPGFSLRPSRPQPVV